MDTNELKLKQIELLNILMDKVSECSHIIFEMEQKATEGMTTSEANKHFEEKSKAFQDAMYQNMSIIANLNYKLKKELGILNNK